MANINANLPLLDYITIDGVSKLLKQGSYAGVPPIVADTFEIGCIIIDTVGGGVYRNSGTTAVPVWTAL